MIKNSYQISPQDWQKVIKDNDLRCPQEITWEMVLPYLPEVVYSPTMVVQTLETPVDFLGMKLTDIEMNLKRLAIKDAYEPAAKFLWDRCRITETNNYKPMLRYTYTVPSNAIRVQSQMLGALRSEAQRIFTYLEVKQLEKNHEI